MSNRLGSTLKLTVSRGYEKAIESDLRYLCKLASNPRASEENQIKLQVKAVLKSMNEAYDIAVRDCAKQHKKQ